MKNICRHVGSQIRFFRKLRGFTLKEFAAQLNKSVSTLSKYESGDISIDIFTLSEIARTLEVTIEQLLPTDYIDTSDQADDSLFSLDNRHFFAQKDIFYMYYSFSSNRKAPNKGITVNVIEIKRNKDAPDEIYLYNDCEMPESITEKASMCITGMYSTMISLYIFYLKMCIMQVAGITFVLKFHLSTHIPLLGCIRVSQRVYATQVLPK